MGLIAKQFQHKIQSRQQFHITADRLDAGSCGKQWDWSTERLEG